jgi:quinol-cytochrome oxidoreductase complex cytochrome b subunit
MRTARPSTSSLMSDSKILQMSSLFLIIEIILLAIWTGVGAPEPVVLKFSSTQWYQTCQVVNSSGTAMAGIMAAYNALLVIVLLFVAFATRSVAERYRDSKNILVVAYILIGTFVVGGIILGCKYLYEIIDGSWWY